MRDGFRQTMAFLHSWAGLFPGWLLYAIFLSGSLTYYRQEITLWMRPELSGAAADPQTAIHAIDRLRQTAPDARLWRIDLPNARNPVTEILWKGEKGGFRSEYLDPRTGGQMRGRETMGGDFLYYFHFDLHAPFRLGRWLVCFAAIAMLVAIISGIITHRRIFADFFTFRPRKGQRSWLDAHNVAGVLALPFCLMISFTGLITLATMFMPWAIQRAYSGDAAAYARDLKGQGVVAAAVSSADAPALSGPMVDHIVGRAEQMWPKGRAGRILVDNPSSKHATVTVERRDADSTSYDLAWLRFSADGRLIARYDGSGPAVTTHGWLYGLHLARFSGGTLRFLFFLSGLLGTAMIATGLILWVVKRHPKNQASPRPMAAERANVAVIAGLPIAIAALLLANRLLPAGMSGRMGWEASAFFLSWIAALMNAWMMPPKRAWTGQLRCLGLLCVAAPIPQMFVPDSGLFAWLRTDDMARTGVDLALFITGLAALAAASKASASRRRKA
ncbi:PepSY-associated TM helix domain-containing protein [Novosphingobium sp. SG707]|uniref:PepSY-associated TM helix domain-containing protein n=1 Tax=Novosphingobium sp. SG707 TaxID=2586996 RepID=UPI001444FB5C|nr:PepSY-associated TM helix domain-containing protein [Novosphingobium sp. SG707]NKJ01661.1 putative iron-regulated membrane protein [Novosphingobium sp. SG707]